MRAHARTQKITYLTPHGGPTVVLNMTTEDGNRNRPSVAAVGHISHPVIGRHTMFDGRMMHGVLPVKSIGGGGSSEPPSHPRVTLLVNWWHRVPQPPNCRALKPDEVNAFVRASGSPSPPQAEQEEEEQQQATTAAPSQTRDSRAGWLWELFVGGLSVLTGRNDGGALGGDDEWVGAVSVKPSSVSVKDASSGSDVMVKLSLETHFLWLPNDPPAGGFGRVRWTGTQSLGAVVEVDVTNDRIVQQLAHSREPKLVYFAPRGGLPGAKRTFFPAVKQLKHNVRAYVAEWGPRSSPLWESFDVQETDAPVVGIEDPATGQRYAHQWLDLSFCLHVSAHGQLCTSDAILHLCIISYIRTSARFEHTPWPVQTLCGAYCQPLHHCRRLYEGALRLSNLTPHARMHTHVHTDGTCARTHTRNQVFLAAARPLSRRHCAIRC
jgi:hypothetical protein